MTDSPRVLLWPRVVAHWRLGADWCVPARVLGVARRLAPIVDPRTLREESTGAGVAFVFDTPTSTFLRDLAPRLLDDDVPFAVCVATAQVRTRPPRRGSDGMAATWRDLGDLVDSGVAIAVRGHDAVDVARLPDELAFGQLARSRQEVMRHLGIEPWLVCDPATSSRPGVIRIARELGFTAGVVRRNGTPLRDDPLRRPAVVPRPWQTADVLERALGRRSRAQGR